jgi:hypothetical protein
VALSVASCSSSGDSGPRKAADLGMSSPYETRVLADGAIALWPLRDADGLRPRDQVADITSAHRAAAVVGGTVTGTSSPGGARAALFLRSGRLVTPVVTGLGSSDAFSLEFAVRADACTTAWGRVLGTTALTDHGREGIDVLHFPSQFQLNPCRLAVEFWHRGRHLGGCHPSNLPPIGRWIHVAVTYQARKVACYEDGRLVGSKVLDAPAVFSQPGPLGIGGSGSGFQGPLDGASISEVAVYDRVLTAAQVRAHVALLRLAPTANRTRS